MKLAVLPLALLVLGSDPAAQRRSLAAPRPTLERTNLRLPVSSDVPTRLGPKLGSFGVPEVEAGADLNGDGDQTDTVLFVVDPATGATTSLGLAVRADALGATHALEGTRVVLAVSESAQGQDLDGNGSMVSHVLFVHDAASGTTTNLKLRVDQQLVLAGGRVLFDRPVGGLAVHDLQSGTTSVILPSGTVTGPLLNAGFAAFHLSEASVSLDLNGDGDQNDLVPHAYDFAASTLRSSGVAGFLDDHNLTLVGHRALFLVHELAQGGVDLTGNGSAQDKLLYVLDAATGALEYTGAWTNFVLDAPPVRVLDQDTFLWFVAETFQALDLNGDGDTFDEVPVVYDAAAKSLVTLPLAMHYTFSANGTASRFLGTVDESFQGSTDLNGDGDVSDDVLFRFDDAGSTWTNLGRAVGELLAEEPAGPMLVLVWEQGEGRDLNGDGDLQDNVLHLVRGDRARNLAHHGWWPDASFESAETLFLYVSELAQGERDLNHDGDTADQVLFVLDREAEVLSNTGLAVWFGGFSGNAGTTMLVPVEESRQGGRDLNGDGDAVDRILHLVRLVR